MINNNLNEELITLVNYTLDELYTKEKYLFENNSSERNLVFHFSRYFLNNIEKNIKFKDYNVECEYGNNYQFKKTIFIDNKEYQIYPDFILHKRGSNDYNLLAIEFKKNKSKSQKDELKLMALTDNNFEYKYKLGLFINLNKTREQVKIIKYANGKITT